MYYSWEIFLILLLLTLVGIAVVAYLGILTVGAMLNGILALIVLSTLFLIAAFIDD